jgi:hypothetical protein
MLTKLFQQRRRIVPPSWVIASPSLWRAAYALIIASEGATALGFAGGAALAFKKRRHSIFKMDSPAASFEEPVQLSEPCEIHRSRATGLPLPAVGVARPRRLEHAVRELI